jgi:hypothetical protein
MAYLSTLGGLPVHDQAASFGAPDLFVARNAHPMDRLCKIGFVCIEP